MKRICALFLGLTVAAASLSGCGAQGQETTQQTFPDATAIVLSDDGVTVDGEAASTDETAAVYTAHDIVYYEDGHDFTYGEGTAADAHTAEEAEAHTVVHITQPGTYALSGTLSAGQIAVDLGEDAEEDPEAVVTLILNGVDITCTVAPAVIFYSVYECGSDDEDTATVAVDTSAAGANVLIADGTINHVTGSYVARIYDPDSVVLSEDGTEVTDSDKLHKYDGAFYSRMSMNVDGGEAGTGVLNITADNEGLDTELHLTINGGTINITSGNDGINTNEDNVSVTTINGGSVNIQVTGETGEGDGIDSNGYLVVNGGTVLTTANPQAGEGGIDSDSGICLNGGTVIALGNRNDSAAADSAQALIELTFRATVPEGSEVELRDSGGTAVVSFTAPRDFSSATLSVPELAWDSTYTLWVDGVQQQYTGTGTMDAPGGGGGGQPPEGMEPPGDGPADGGGTPPAEEPPAGETPPEPTGTPSQGEGMEPPEGGQPPENMEPGGRPGDGGAADEPGETAFVITADSHAFQGVGDLVSGE